MAVLKLDRWNMAIGDGEPLMVMAGMNVLEPKFMPAPTDRLRPEGSRSSSSSGVCPPSAAGWSAGVAAAVKTGVDGSGATTSS